MLMILNRTQIINLEAKAIASSRCSSKVELYEIMASGFCNQFARQFNDNRSIIVFAGPTQNGAIALAISRILVSMQRKVITILLNPNKRLTEEVMINRNKLLEYNGELHEFTESFRSPKLTENDIVIDGIMGLEQEGALDESLAAVTKYLNSHSPCILSIDIPTGLSPEDKQVNNMDTVICAKYTYTFHAAKLAFLMGDYASYVGQWRIIDCGFEKEYLKNNTRYHIFTMSDIEDALDVRDPFTDKRDYGHVAIIAGSKCMMGAAMLSAKACMRTGAGLLTVHVPKGKDDVLHAFLPEALIEEDDSATYFTDINDIDKYDAIAIGPGLGQKEMSAKGLRRLLSEATCPLVIDADALNMIGADETLLPLIPKNSILTPHHRELERIVGRCSSDFERLDKASNLAKTKHLFVILKGTYTAICLPSGVIIFNQTGNPGMATAGAGDVLTGMLVSLLGQGYSALSASVFGVFLHGFAGDRYAEENCQESLIASDIINNIPKVFKYFKRFGVYR